MKFKQFFLHLPTSFKVPSLKIYYLSGCGCGCVCECLGNWYLRRICEKYRLLLRLLMAFWPNYLQMAPKSLKLIPWNAWNRSENHAVQSWQVSRSKMNLFTSSSSVSLPLKVYFRILTSMANIFGRYLTGWMSQDEDDGKRIAKMATEQHVRKWWTGVQDMLLWSSEREREASTSLLNQRRLFPNRIQILESNYLYFFEAAFVKSDTEMMSCSK